MKLVLLFSAIILTAFACQNAPKENPETTKETTEVLTQEAFANALKVEISIEGMTCTGCENTIQNKINEFEGVYSSKADFEKGIAFLEFDSTKVDLLKIEEAINQVGYKTISHKKLSE